MLAAKKDVPRYEAAEGERGSFIRRMNGQISWGRLSEGECRTVD